MPYKFSKVNLIVKAWRFENVLKVKFKKVKSYLLTLCVDLGAQ